ncbi:protein SFI1 homolog isoform X1 [Eumetopias jubatus]|uniref:protein SFI1 homolog isoform X1 n=1 Tax=Eumetopias jubatus TaxID=34886 RepID=UPI001016CB56|nr:protein SFI1 homolog isoform X1 [Eumetopias jubatus]XP_027980512.1 protein SFI1 homolog isoform X1 [Eumetopias jubatus]XP_027980513.1 protein SFI1 homolog isoform X1 [Eumetopias jubatus]XP_027980514.1 protein SFI1 homolog isoform X1 [Eumetopias jubatus]XP_027980515.1 protein SFI1 homolog isoform X1 [Eumetopias jubatus]XP_027980516.1 protein SFI1 homolog isoform X1 [Eumetopias jubatus]XP_027980517.1 protein SFI1 homolog isoform X1 [Eumetopias jubatus]XP_027980518.1 protein SFI1 homolog iso
MKNLLTEKCISSHCQISIKREVSRECRGRWTPDKSPEVELWIIWSFKDGAVKKTYPPKILANQKSSAFSGMRSEIPSASHPVQYHASHGWTRRNRLRELRIRCVARKFLYLWIQMTFGRVFPSKARFYYEQRILRKVFEEWKEEWWVFQREWKLCVRADCHYRYYLYNLMFQTWRTYVHQQQEMRAKYIRAEKHDARQKMWQAWKSWLIYVVFRRTKLQMQTTALEFRQRSILWLWWSQWRQQLGQVRVGHALLASAVKHRALSLQLQAWSRWWEQLLHVQRERQKMVSAVKHREHWEKWKSLKAWLKYLRVRRVKRQWNEMAERFHRVTMLQTHFSDWQWAWERKESLYAQHARVEGLARRMALRRAFTHWKHYVLLYAEEVAQRKVAEEHRRRSLLHFCFRALKDNVTHAHFQQIRRNLAHQQYDITLLHRFWDLWQTRIEQREEREQLPSLCAAWDRCRISLLRKCIRSWLQYTQKRRYKQRLRSRADSHFEQRVLPAAFHTWRRFWRWHQQESVLNVRAARFHRETLEKQVFAIWWQKMFQHRENRLAERMAILHSEQQLLQRSWSTWHQQAAARHRERQWTAAAWAHRRHRQLRRAFCIWRDSARGLRTEKTGLVLAAEFHSARILHWAWGRWKEGLALRAAERQKLTRARLHHRRTLLRGALRTWATYQSRVRSVLQEVAARERQHGRRLLRYVFRRWRENTLARVAEAQQTSRASAHYRRTLCSKVLVQWREAASVQIYYRQQEDRAIKEARKVLDKGCLRTCFWRWRDRGRRAAEQRAQLRRAAAHHGRRRLLQAMARWKAHHLGCVRKRLLQRQGAQLLAQTRSRACFCQWKQQLANRRREQQGTARALWFWSFSLQAKVWAAWLGFVLERRRKKARQEQAIQAYHRQLLQEGATRLLRFTAGMKALRQQLHAQQQVQAAHSLHRAVHRCAMLWKQKVLGQGREPRPLTCTMPSRKVTFDRPLSTCVEAGAGDAALETKKPQDPHGPRGALGSLSLAAGDPYLLELNAARLARKQPRRPHFLLEPVPSQRPLGCGTLGGKGPEAPRACDPGVAQPAGPALRRPFLPVAWTALVPSSVLPQPGALLGHPGPKLPPTLNTGPELLPPSSFMPCGVQAPARAPAQPTTPGLTAQASPSPASVPHSRLLLPGDFTGTGRPGSASAGAQLKPVSTEGARATPDAWDPSIQPWPSRDRGPDPRACSVTKGPMDLEAELEGIQQQLQDYQTMKQNLSSCQRQARSLRRWLELSHEEPRPEDQEAERQVQEELQEVERQIQRLASELQAQRQPVSACIARVQALRRALC